MEHLGDVDQVKAFFSPLGDDVNLGARWVHGLRRMYHGHRNLFGRTQWTSLVTWVKRKLILIYLEIVLISTQDWCTVCAERAIGSKIILGTPDGTPR
jgi:hypothetical protein